MDRLRGFGLRVFHNPFSGEVATQTRERFVSAVAKRESDAKARERLGKMSFAEIIDHYGDLFIRFVQSDKDARAILPRLGLPYCAVIRRLLENHCGDFVDGLLCSRNGDVRAAALDLILSLSSQSASLIGLDVNCDDYLGKLRECGIVAFRAIPEWLREIFFVHHPELAVSAAGCDYHEVVDTMMLLLETAQQQQREEFLLKSKGKFLKALAQGTFSHLATGLCAAIGKFIKPIAPSEEEVRFCWKNLAYAYDGADFVIGWIRNLSLSGRSLFALCWFDEMHTCLTAQVIKFNSETGAGIGEDKINAFFAELINDLSIEEKIQFLSNVESVKFLRSAVSEKNCNYGLLHCVATCVSTIPPDAMSSLFAGNANFFDLFKAVIEWDEFSLRCFDAIGTLSEEQKVQFFALGGGKPLELMEDERFCNAIGALIGSISCDQNMQLFTLCIGKLGGLLDSKHGARPTSDLLFSLPADALRQLLVDAADSSEYFAKHIISSDNGRLRSEAMTAFCAAGKEWRKQFFEKVAEDFCMRLLSSADHAISSDALRFMRTFSKSTRMKLVEPIGGKLFFPCALTAPSEEVRRFAVKIFQAFPPAAKRSFLEYGAIALTFLRADFEGEELWNFLLDAYDGSGARVSFAAKCQPDDEVDFAKCVAPALFSTGLRLSMEDGSDDMMRALPGLIWGGWLRLGSIFYGMRSFVESAPDSCSEEEKEEMTPFIMAGAMLAMCGPKSLCSALCGGKMPGCDVDNSVEALKLLVEGLNGNDAGISFFAEVPQHARLFALKMLRMLPRKELVNVMNGVYDDFRKSFPSAHTLREAIIMTALRLGTGGNGEELFSEHIGAEEINLWNLALGMANFPSGRKSTYLRLSVAADDGSVAERQTEPAAAPSPLQATDRLSSIGFTVEQPVRRRRKAMAPKPKSPNICGTS
ncbi:MAG: hypothetical protein LBI39_03020 [Puniceicoccales bacterium]|jgi:hypothetical protein|nr:hypothetical protein [Puniceicoccales bacterium]